MTQNYKLMHKNDVVATISLDDGNLDTLVVNAQELMPYMGITDKTKLKKWLENRSIPGTREDLRRILENAGCETSAEYLYKNLAVSINDCYWLCPASESLDWKDVNPYINYCGSRMEFHNDTSYDPSAALGGQMTKYVDMRDDGPYIVKADVAFNGLRCLNEKTASTTHALQGWNQYVDYHAFKDEKSEIVFCESKAFTSEKIEFVPAIEIIDSQKQPNELSNYDFYIQRCEELGIDNARQFMDYMTATDFIISNQDRHLNNFGILRDADSLQAISMAPIFDTGNSMFYRDQKTKPMSRQEILELPISSFHKTEEKMIGHIQDRNIVNLDKLLTKEQVYSYYQKANIPEDRAKLIAANYETKRELFAEFQRGKAISVYMEKQKKKAIRPKELEFER